MSTLSGSSKVAILQSLGSIRNILVSPAVPALLVLYGMLFALAFSHYTGQKWSLAKTGIVYGLAAMWALALWLWNRPLRIVFSPIDLLYGAFVLLVFISILVQLIQTQHPQWYWRYVPFLILPYAICRFMTLSDIRLLLSLVAIAGVGFIPLLVIESRNSYETYGRLLRPVLFGYIHPILPASILLGSATLVFFSWMLTHCRRNGIQHRGAGWNGLVAIGGLLTTLTYVAVRSALLATIGMTIVAAAATVWIPFRRRVTLLAYVFAVTSACMLMFSYQIPYYAKLSQAVGSPLLLWLPWLYASSALAAADCDTIRADRDSIAIRQAFLRKGIAMFYAHPVFGVGAGAFGQHSCLAGLGHPHSTIVHVFAELGLAGGLLFLGLISASLVTLARALRQAGEQQRPVILGLLLLLGMALLTDQIQGNYFYSLGFFSFVGAVAAMRSPWWRQPTRSAPHPT